MRAGECVSEERERRAAKGVGSVCAAPGRKTKRQTKEDLPALPQNKRTNHFGAIAFSFFFGPEKSIYNCA